MRSVFDWLKNFTVEQTLEDVVVVIIFGENKMAAQPGDHLYQPQPGERVETQQEKEAKEARHGRARMSSTLSEVLPISHPLFVGKRIHTSHLLFIIVS
jgi:hypothetical protein